MTFSTATIQGYVTAIRHTTTPQKRLVVNMLVAVPNKRKQHPEDPQSDTYIVSVWDNQAASALEFISADRKQIITASGQLKLDDYSVANGKAKMRLDFASILDYGNSKEKHLSDKQKYTNMVEMENALEEVKASTRKKTAKV
jgi:single-stranded DNA-binding protein